LSEAQFERLWPLLPDKVRVAPRTIVLADKAYDSNAIRDPIERQGAVPNIPSKATGAGKVASPRPSTTSSPATSSARSISPPPSMVVMRSAVSYPIRALELRRKGSLRSLSKLGLDGGLVDDRPNFLDSILSEFVENVLREGHLPTVHGHTEKLPFRRNIEP
jgi:hypothetical protein